MVYDDVRYPDSILFELAYYCKLPGKQGVQVHTVSISVYMIPS